MGCCSSFTAYRTTGTPDPARHVNYVTGMVLGVDDYAQEFAYHSGRAKWIVRDFLGYGTLSGLAVSVQPDGDGGAARVHVTPGSAAVPSGQMVCVGREQCGEIGQWLLRPEVKAELERRANGADELDLEMFLTLCYTDCEVDDVPIPGEPCRSEENLMAPSRVADDYCLSFAFDPPLDIEAHALDVLAGWSEAVSAAATAGGEADPANFGPLVERGIAQILAALGVHPGPVAPGDLDPVIIDPAVLPQFLALLPRAWITAIRPRVMAQVCSAPATAANDCIALTTLRFRAKKGMDNKWVAPAAADIVDDQSGRRFMLSAMAVQSAAAPLLAPPPPAFRVAFFNDDSPDPAVPWPVNEVVVSHANDFAIKLPVGDASQARGAVIVLRHYSAQKLEVGNALRDGAAAVLNKRGTFRLTYDGAAAWDLTAIDEEEG